MSAAASHRMGRLEAWLVALVGTTALVVARNYPVWRDHIYVACPAWAILGVPCPACGATRAVAAVLQGELGQAFAWNPLGALAALAAIVLVPIGVAAGLGWITRPQIPTTLGLGARAALIVAPIANWAYLLAAFEG
ncbi:MAG: DUF2752 domain-containing protein [Acidobacteria bacterium]|nr:DUF2752 domain-containing protein [Acidobacteriota bacterium]